MQRLADITDAPSAWRELQAMASQRAGDLALDIGANVGQASRLMAPYFRHVIAFEPALESYEVLVAECPGNVDAWSVAVSDHAGPLLLDVAETAIGTGQLISGTAIDGHPEWGQIVGFREVTAVTIDECVGRLGVLPAVVKIDTEGHEKRVMLGAGHVRALGFTSWFIEVHSSDQGAFISCGWGADYEVERIDHDYLSAERGAEHYYLVARPKWL